MELVGIGKFKAARSRAAARLCCWGCWGCWGCCLLVLFAQCGFAADVLYKQDLSALPEFGFAEPFFEKVGDADSIPDASVTALAQDSSGLLWIGTQNGLVRYDGYRFRKFTHLSADPNSLAGDFINCLLRGAGGRLWIGTSSAGLSMFDPVTERFENFRHNPKQSNSISAGPISAIAANANGGLWIGTDSGLDYLPPGAREFVHYRHNRLDAASLASDQVYSLLMDRKGSLWVGTSAGLQRLALGSDGIQSGKGFERIASDPADPASLAGREILELFEAADGKLWLGTAKDGAAWLHPSRLQPHWLPADPTRPDRLTHGRITEIKQPQAGQIWLGSISNGINIVNARDGQVVQRLLHDPSVAGSLAQDQVSAMLVDKSGLLLVGTLGGGVQRHNAQNRTFRIVNHSPVRPRGLSHNNIISVLELTNGQILAGTWGNGIDILDRQRGLIGGYRALQGTPGALPDAAISALVQTPDGTLWAGTLQTGVLRLAPGTDKWQAYNMEHGLPNTLIYSLFVSRDGGLWAGTAGGPVQWQAQTQRFKPIPLFDGSALEMPFNVWTEDTKGRIWVGNDAGLWVLEPGGKGFRSVVDDPARATSLGGKDVRGLLSDSQGRFWVSTEQGLNRLVSWDGHRAEFLHVKLSAGRSFGVNLMEDKAGRIWSSDFIFDPRQMRMYPLSKSDGFDIGSNWSSSYFRMRDGLLLYGGTEGLAIADPSQFRPWNYQPAVRATELKINGLPALLGLSGINAEDTKNGITGADSINPTLTLRPVDRNFSIEFSALDFSAPQKNRYAYRLQGYDQDWIETDAEHRAASYGNLWPGKYTLQVRGSNRMGEWSAQQLQIPIQVLPAFWQSGWFLTLLLLALGGAGYAVYYWRLARIRALSLGLQQRVDARTADILKLREIGQELTSTLDTEQAFERVWRQVRARLDTYAFLIGRYDARNELIDFVYVVENSQRRPGMILSVKENDNKSAQCMIAGCELVAGTEADLRRFIEVALPSSTGRKMETTVYLPLLLETQMIGCLIVQSPKPHAYNGDQLDFLRVLASYTAIALSNASAHSELAQSHSQLAAAHRHLKEAQAKLVQSEKMASLGGLVVGIAHEINTPLGTTLMAISGMSGIFKEQQAALTEGRLSRSMLETGTQEGIQYANLGQRAATRAAELINTFKSVAVQADNDQPMAIDLAAYLPEVASLMQVLLEQNGSRLEIEVTKGLYLYSVADALAETLSRVLANVVDHAFSEGKPGLLRLSAYADKDHENELLVIEVSDNGHGIAAEDLPKVFDPFFTTKSGKQGHVGLGLHVAYNQVTQRLKGEISIASTVGQGTSVTLRLKRGMPVLS